MPIRPTEKEYTSLKSKSFAKQSFENCRIHHSECRQRLDSNGENVSAEPIPERDLPARLLKITSDLAKGNRHIQLKEIRNESITVREEICRGGYASLSYCWGTDQPQKLTVKTQGELKRGINTGILPKTLQDAIEFTTLVGLEYIWIDAMCILQDDNADKEIEIARMPLYYGGNTLTISAASSTKCTDGIIGRSVEPAFTAGPFEVPFTTPAGVGSIQFLASKSLPSEPIDHRGWTYQESALSRRALVFASDQLRWHCLSDDFSCGGHEANFEGKLDNMLSGKRLRYAYHFQNPRPMQWNEIVQEYTSRKLTNGSDKLLAISALADQVHTGLKQKHSDLTYLAGLFVIPKSIWSWIDQLVWTSWSHGIRDNAIYRAPSWSWACLDTEKEMTSLRAFLPPPSVRHRVEVDFTIRDFEVKLGLQSALFGSVIGAHVVVGGYIKCLGGGSHEVEVEFPQDMAPLVQLVLKIPDRNSLSLIPDTKEDHALMSAALNGKDPIYLLEMILPLLEPGRSHPGIGLILKEANPGQKNSFQRIGLYILSCGLDNEALERVEVFWETEFQEVIII